MNESLLSIYTTPATTANTAKAFLSIDDAKTAKKRARLEATQQPQTPTTTTNIIEQLVIDGGSGTVTKKQKARAVKWNAPKVKLQDLGGIEHCIEVWYLFKFNIIL